MRIVHVREVLLSVMLAAIANAQTKPTIVLVHGAFADIAAATQKPLAAAVFDQSNPGAGWKTIPSWYIVAKKDQAINPDAERFYAKRANATTKEVESSHVVFLAHPDAVVSVIVDAATAAAKH